MSDLVERLRKDGNSTGAYVPSYSCGPILTIEAAARIEALEAALEDRDEALRKIESWSRAYPLDIFPEPDWKKAAQLLNAGGMTLDRISGACMRHVIESVGLIAKEALCNE